ncbi:hypothetical protein GR254_25005, partial [Mycobacterium tuberculosis]|nr:hypothetical protein [Mycobacterium tuberculosis]
LNAIQAHPGVGSASLNYPLSRVVVAIDDPDTSLRELCRIVELNAIQAHPGVGSASLNYPLSRVVVAIDDPDTSL